MGLFDMFGPEPPSGGLLDSEPAMLPRDKMLPLILMGMGQGIIGANQPGASFGQAVMGGGMSGASNGINQVMQLQAYQQKLRDAAADRAWKNDQRQAARGQMSAQATLQGGYDPLSKIDWNGPRGSTPDTPPNERMALLARAYPEHFARQSLEAEFPTPSETEKLATRLAKMPQDDPMRPFIESRLGALGSESGFRFGPDGATPIPGGPADPDYLNRRYAAMYGNRTTEFERMLADLPEDEQAALREARRKKLASGGRGAGDITEPQARINAEIDQARSELASKGYTEEQIRKFTSRIDPRTGMDNPEYKIMLSPTLRRAMQKKYGEDSEFESFRNKYSGLMPDLPPGEGPEGVVDVPMSGDPSSPDKTPAQYAPGMTPKHGQVYTLPNGAAAKWDDLKKKFIVVD